MSEEQHPAESVLEEYVRRNGQVTEVLNSRREALGDSHEHGLEKVLDAYAANNDVDDPSLSDIHPSHFLDKNFQELYAEGVTDHLAQQAAEYIGLDGVDQGSLDEHELMQLYTGATKEAVEQQVKGYLAQLNGVEDLTSSNLAKHIQDELDEYGDIENKVRQYSVSHIDNEHKEDIADYAGVGGVYRTEFTPEQILAQQGAQRLRTGDTVGEDEAVQAAIQYQVPQAVNTSNIDTDLANQIEGLATGELGRDITDDYNLN